MSSLGSSTTSSSSTLAHQKGSMQKSEKYLRCSRQRTQVRLNSVL
jgi:hypothetical protein